MAQGDKLNFWRRHPLIIVFSTALVLRGMFALFYHCSPFSYYHLLPGLDMETLLRFGEWGRTENHFFFTLHRLQVFTFWKLNGNVHPVMWHVLFQALLGAAGAAMVGAAALRLTGKKHLALLSGVVWALNPVELMYEFTTLQDSLVNFGIILSIFAFLEARKRYFAPLFALGAGAAAGVAATGRPVAIGLVLCLGVWNLYYLYHRKLPLKRILFFAGGVLAVWGVFSTVNLIVIKRFNCFFNPVSYAVAVNTTPASASGAPAPVSSVPPLVKTVFKMALRTPQLLSPEEIPENLNIHFLRTKIPFFRIPFEFIPPCAAAAILFLLGTGLWKKKEGFLLLPVFALALFLCIREPIGRYRLLLLPWFTILAVWLFNYLAQKKKGGVMILTLAMLLFGTCSLQAPRLRGADYFAWGMALEKEAGKTTPEALKEFKTAFLLKPDTNHAVSLITRAMKANDRELAQGTARKWMAASRNSTLSCYYAALAAFPEMDKMEHFLSLVKEKELPQKLRFRYYFMRGDISCRKRRFSEAAVFYKSALQLPEGTPAQRSYATQMIQKTEKKK